ncbi:LLM class flavin-dependent oxidoreductase [Tianweitania sediminis]|uniref:LLM class flavin-dependent oxidoreductase n=1 Tax=Tianweitania sediminis TaxID=1502156 RepID=A0A8J7R0U7_9HYPH|nr:LLM class flavin-dependent oxidoreductase [Tianweitania sediminis]MBP0439097.1 LLM class flavin-dependent oxidoreductase [Tianweitania sediminis]
MAKKRQLSLALSLGNLGYHPACWRHPDVPADGNMRFSHYVEALKLAEQGRFDMMFLADVAATRDLDNPKLARERLHHIVKHEPLTLLAALAAVTEHVGLVATASTTYNHPFDLARKFATIDHISGGRAGWNIVTSFSPDEARNFGYDSLPDGKFRHERAKEFIAVTRGLWDSWAENAFPRDKESGVYLDVAKLNVLNHKGEHFSVRGPLDVARPPQGYPVAVTAGDSAQSQDFAADYADVLYAGQPDLESARAYYAGVKQRLAARGRDPDSLKIMPGVMAFIGETEAEARAKFDEMQRLIDPKAGLGMILPIFGDMSHLPLDEPVPLAAVDGESEYVDFQKHGSAKAKLIARVKEDRLTVRQLYEAIAEGYWHLGMVCTPVQLADMMEEWLTTGAADGFIYLPPFTNGAVKDFVTLVTPELQRRGLLRLDYEGKTLRDNLGLPKVPWHKTAAETGRLAAAG